MKAFDDEAETRLASMVGVGAEADGSSLRNHGETRVYRSRLTPYDGASTGYRPDRDVDSRWIIETRFREAGWVIIVEPHTDREFLDVITAFAEDTE